MAGQNAPRSAEEGADVEVNREGTALADPPQVWLATEAPGTGKFYGERKEIEW